MSAGTATTAVALWSSNSAQFDNRVSRRHVDLQRVASALCC
jgi:hypothetical protein